MRDGLSAAYRDGASLKILEALLRLPDYERIRRVFLFCSVGSEPATTPWMERFWRDEKQVACPRTSSGGHMEFYRVRSIADCAPGRYGIPEPMEGCPLLVPDEDTWVLTPGLLFDGRGYRIGYGGGFYDRYMTRFPEAHYIGVGFADQYREENWPVSPFDRRIERLVTDLGVYLYEEGRQ